MQAARFDPDRLGRPQADPRALRSRPFLARVATPKAPGWLEQDSRPLDWNGPVERPYVPFTDDDLDRPIIAGLEQVTRRDPHRIALTSQGASLTFAQLWDGLSGLAQVIGARTSPGDLVGLLLPTGVTFPIAMFACLAAGRPFVALDPDAPEAWLGEVMEDARPALIIAGARTGLPTVAAAAERRVIRLTGLPGPASKRWRPTPRNVDEPACVLFTSGSTGRPKGVANNQRSLLRRAAQSINAAHINSDDRFLTLASPASIVEVRDILTALLAGASIHLLDPRGLGARQTLDVIRAQAITILFAFPTLLRTVLAAGGAGGRMDPVLRLVRVGGDTTLWSDIDLLRTWLAPGAAIQSVYAATEAPMMQWFVDDAVRGDDLRIPIGYPLQGARLSVIHESGRPASPGEVGELTVEGAYVASGHWVDGRCVSGAFAAGGPSRRRFQTGDLVRQRPDGLIERLGRKDRQVKIRGARVELDGVEAALRRHPHVRDVAALARTVDGAASLVAYVSACDWASARLLEELKALMRQSPAPMRPSRLYLTDEIPRLPSSKLDVPTLAALDQAKVQDERAEALTANPGDGDDIARTVARIWRDVLQAPPQDDDEDFFDAGGDSLKAITLMIELETALGAELPMSMIHEAPAFSGLCRSLRALKTARYAPLVTLKAGEGPAPVFFIHGAGGNVADLFPIARNMTWSGAVIGIQARGLMGRDAPHPTVEAMAEEYLAAVRARQPDGPYYLCGYSFGGLVAFELARRLRESGSEVGLLGLFDTMISPLAWPPQVWLGSASRRLVQIAARAIAAPIRDWPAAVGRLHDRLRCLLAQTPSDGPPAPVFLKCAPARVLKVAANALVASARYRPGPYPGEVTLFLPAERDPTLPSPAEIWRRHAGAVSVIDTAGGHLTMLSMPNAASAAASLTRCLPAG